MARLTFRQGIVNHQSDTGGNPTFLAVAGANVNLIVSPDFTTIAFAHGSANYLYTEKVSVNAAWGPHAAQDYWLYWDLNLASGQVTRGSTTLEPIVGATAPPSPTNGQMWFDITKSTWFVYSTTRFRECVRVFAAKLSGGSSLSSMSINAPSYKGTQVGLSTGARAGSLVFSSTGKPIRGDNNRFFTTEDTFLTGVPSTASLRINSIIVTGEATGNLPAYTAVQYNAFNKIGQANPFTQGLRLYGIIEEDAVPGEVVNFITEGMIANPAWDWVAAGAGANTPVYVTLTGALGLVPVASDQLPVGVVTGPQEILFAPSLFPQVSTTVAPIGAVTKADITDFVEGDYVHKAGPETITGIKTFTAAPISIDPTADQEVATKKYVDDNAGGTVDNTKVAKVGDTMTGDLIFTGAGTGLLFPSTVNVGDELIVHDETGGTYYENTESTYYEESRDAVFVGSFPGRSVEIKGSGIDLHASLINGADMNIRFGNAVESAGVQWWASDLGVGSPEDSIIVDTALTATGGSMILTHRTTTLELQDAAIAVSTVVEGITPTLDNHLATKGYVDANAGGGGATTLDGLTDVDTSTVAPTDGQALVWDNANSIWEPGTIAGGGTDNTKVLKAGDTMTGDLNMFDAGGDVTLNFLNVDTAGTAPGIEWRTAASALHARIRVASDDGGELIIERNSTRIEVDDGKVSFNTKVYGNNSTVIGDFGSTLTTKNYVDKLIPSFLPMSFSGVLPDSTEVAKFVIPSAFTVETTGHPIANANSASSGGTADFILKKNGTTFGTITFANGIQAATVSIPSQTSFVANDRLTVETGTQNGIDTVSITIVLTRVM